MNAVEQIKQKLDMDLYVRVAQEKSRRTRKAEIIPFPAPARKEERCRGDLRQNKALLPGSKIERVLRRAIQRARTPQRTKGRH